MLLLFIVLILVIPVFLLKDKQKWKKKNLPVKNTHLPSPLLPDKNIEDEMTIKMKPILKRYFPDANMIEFTNINIKDSVNEMYVFVEARLLMLNINSFNAKVIKIQLEGTYKKGIGVINVKNLIINPGCPDIGSIIPENSDKFFDKNFVNSSWESTKAFKMYNSNPNTLKI